MINLKEKLTYDFLNQEYVVNKKSSQGIANSLNCSPSSVIKYMIKNNMARRGMSESRKGRKNIKASEFRKGKTLKELGHKNNCQCIVCVHRSGKDNPNWQGGITPIHVAIRMSREMLQWNQRVLNRDNFTCQDCGQIGRTLEVHHKKPFHLILKEFLEMNSIFSPIEDKETLIRLAFIYPDFWDVCNGITLCEKCHEKIPCKPVVIND